MPVRECDESVARERFEAAGYEVSEGNTDHERWRVEAPDATAIGYEGKVVIQGAEPATLEGVLREGSGRVHVYCDGASRGNPGPAAIGWVLVTDDGIVNEGGDYIGEATNNQAEYEALIRALEVAGEFGFDEVDIRSDSELVVRQVTGEWNVNDPELRDRRVRVRSALDKFDEWTIQHVPREVNERADEMANEALDNRL